MAGRGGLIAGDVIQLPVEADERAVLLRDLDGSYEHMSQLMIKRTG
jgi:hypothetical protein